MKIHPALQEFNPRDYGYKSGLEVHHQLLTQKKLFCRCPAGLYSDEYHAQVVRHMRPTLSELGEYDGTALMEFKTKKVITYRLNKESVCTYEMDDNPPFLINRQAVDIAIEIALMLNCSIVGELHVARKQYLDGSIPAGFQRTAIVGLNGWIPYKDRKINIIQLAIEEDACREVSDNGHERVYTTDRLSMPLIEVVTAPEMFDPQELFEVGNLISDLLRTTGKVRRGIGSVRQDVNISVEGGTRVEIKGVPRIPLFPSLAHYEAYRQHQLLTLRDKLNERGITKDSFASEKFDVTAEIDHFMMDRNANEDFHVGAIVLKGMAGLLSYPIGSTRTFADDIAGRVRVIACIQHQPILIHTDEDTSEILSEQDLAHLREIANMSDDDSAIIVWGDKGDVDTALGEIDIRCMEATIGIPNETRQRLSNGETDFERILPGANRMYPDTDSPPLALSEAEVDLIRAILPERPWIRRDRLKKLGLSDSLIKSIIVSPRISLFNTLVEDQKIDPILAANVLGELLIHARRLGADLAELEDEQFALLFNLYNKKKFSREAFRLILEDFAVNGESDWNHILKQMAFESVDDDKLKSSITEIVKENADKGTKDAEARTRFLMGRIMDRYRGAVAGAKILEVLSKV